MKKMLEILHWNHRQGDHVVEHNHNGIEIIYYATGTGMSSINNEEYHYFPNSLFMIPKGVTHYEQTFTDTEVFTCVFDSDELGLNSVFISNPKFKRAENILKELKTLIVNIATEYAVHKKDVESHSRELEVPLKQIHYMVSLILDIYALDTKETDIVAEKVRAYINKNYKYKLNYAILASNSGYSYDRLRHIFIEHFHISLKQYQLGVQLANAKSLLLKTDLKVGVIAKRCGFADSESFIHLFKKKTQLTPKQFRTNAKMKHSHNTFNITEIETDNSEE